MMFLHIEPFDSIPEAVRHKLELRAEGCEAELALAGNDRQVAVMWVGPERLRVVCAWCGLHLSGPVTAPLISHGICPSCLEGP